ncbi:molybdenum cofactor biosynthesis protein MoaE [Pacificimonas flava]|uniref:Molybdopterin synthase catalytic subunit n=1 Tax=Pacificimonas flava TaxID=1234595 RepID=A0A219B8I2_9SPHN|nr:MULTISPECIES: molybdenum cofactor biosynthesis protein MoaE [Pacificimonas]OWV34463.1 molybdenum cofactor biosynthesis protein MoaE [Pacificimonas flava]
MPPTIACRVQERPFDSAAELELLETNSDGEAGAVVSFTGLVRGQPGSKLELQHYPGMTQRQMESIAGEAARRFELIAGTVIHRHGILQAGAPIVFVGVSSRHRAAAFDGARFLMDWLKTRAPFWKREIAADGTAHWVEARTSDDEAAASWD